MCIFFFLKGLQFYQFISKQVIITHWILSSVFCNCDILKSTYLQMFNIYFSFLKIIKHICYKILPEKRKCKYASMQIPFCICLILQFFLTNEQWIQYATSTSIFRCYWLRVQYLLYVFMSYQSTAARSQVTCRIECNLIELCFSVSILSFLDRCILIYV